MSIQKNKTDPKSFKDLPIVGKQPESEKEEKYLRDMVSYEFVNNEEPGMMLTFTYGNTRKNATFKLFHGANYDLPRHVGRWIQSRATPVKKYSKDGMGHLHAETTGWNPRFQLRETMQF